jgi:hypothetical protein
MSYSYSNRRRRRGVATWRKVAAVAGMIAGVSGLAIAGVKMARERAHIPVVLADARPVRVRPAKPGGLHVPGSDLMLDETEEEQVSLAIPAEQPALSALRAKQAAGPFAEAPPE